MISSFKEEPWKGFSNFAPLQFPIERWGMKFRSVETAYMAHKTEDIRIRKQIS